VGKVARLIVVLALALFIAALTFSAGDKVPIILLSASFGLIIVLLCYAHIEIGFYLIIAIGFIVADAERIFMGQYPFTSVVLAMPWLLMIFLLFKEMQKKDFSWLSWHPIVYLFFLLTAYTVVEIFNPQMDSLLGWVSAFWQRLSYLFLLFISCYVFRDLKKIRFFFKFLIITIFITALYGCIQQWIGLAPFDKRWVYDDPHIAGLYSLPGGGLRKFSFLTDPANFGTFMAGGASMLIIFFAEGHFRKRNKMLLLLFILVIILGMSYSGTRTANFMIVTGLALYILMTIYKKRTQILAFMAGLAFLFIMYLPIYGNITLNRFRTSFSGDVSENASMDTRLIHRHMMQPYMHAHPFGGGINTAGAPGEKYNPHHFLAGFPPDGAYFASALNTGWIGLAINCLFYFAILFYCVHYYYRCKNNEIKLYYAGMAAMLFALFLGAYAQFTVSSVPQSLIFIPLLAIIAKLHTFDTPLPININS
jgi:hypothetical protein